MKRLVFVGYMALNETRQRSFRFDDLAARGFHVGYWDISALYGHTAENDGLMRSYVRRFGSWREFEAALAEPETSETIIVPGFGYEPKTFGVYWRLSRSKARLCQILTGVIPEPAHLLTLADKLRFAANPAKLAHFLAKRGMLAARKIGWIRNFDLALVAGDDARALAAGIPSVLIHHCDYDDWVEMAASDSRPVAGRYAVFLDQYLPSHPDYAIEGVRDRIDPIRFYSALNTFFKRLEDRHGLEVVIAAHPKADYTLNPFDGRKILKSETRRLSRFCEFAITSYSSAVGYPVLARKPVTIIDSDEIVRVHKPIGVDLWPRLFSTALGCRYIRLDHPDPADVNVDEPNEKLYDSYKYRYLVSREVESTHSREMLARLLSEPAEK